MKLFTGLSEMKVSQSFRFGMKFRPLGKDQNSQKHLTFGLDYGIMKTITLADMQSIVA